MDELDGTGAQILPMRCVKCFKTEDEAINFIYSTGHDPILMQNRAILAATNKSVDVWNSEIQSLVYSTFALFSRYGLWDVYIPHITLRSMLTK